jgi:phosphoribosylformylglycinamidine synthase
MVGTANMSTNRATDAALVHVAGTKKALAVTTDCNSRYVNANPQVGCAMAVSEAVRNIACSGGEPLGVTNCLNFGNPYNPEVYWQFANAIMGMKAACEKFNTPVTGGNVSFYNQSSYDGPVYPTPTIGMVGLLEDMDQDHMTLDFKTAGDLIYLIGKQPEDIACSEYVYRYHKVALSPAPYFNLDEEFALYQSLRKLTGEKLVKSAHDLSEGGLAIALLEAAFTNKLGFEIQTGGMRKDAFLFGEASGRVIVTVSESGKAAFEAAMNASGVPTLQLGKVTAGNAMIDGADFGPVASFANIYSTALENKLFGK